VPHSSLREAIIHLAVRADGPPPPKPKCASDESACIHDTDSAIHIELHAESVCEVGVNGSDESQPIAEDRVRCCCPVPPASMGNLLRVLYNRENDSPNRVDVFVDFESKSNLGGTAVCFFH